MLARLAKREGQVAERRGDCCICITEPAHGPDPVMRMLALATEVHKFVASIRYLWAVCRSGQRCALD